MNLRQVRLVYFKEMKDILRDKRTVRLMVLVPVVFYPLLIFGMSGLAVGMAEKQQAKIAPVLLVGASPGSPIDSVFRSAEDRIRVVSPDEFEANVRALNPGEFAAAVNNVDAWSRDPYGLSDSTRNAFYYSAIKGKAIDCIVQLSPNFDPHGVPGDTLHASIYYDEQEFRSDASESKVRKLMQSYRDSLSVNLLLRDGLNDAQARRALSPFGIWTLDIAPAEKKSGFLLAMMLPYMIVLLTMMGGMYPAIDLTAGEKERGTLETILASPAGRTEITAGKFLTVFTAAITTVILGALSMTITSGLGLVQFEPGAAESASFALAVNPTSIALVILLMIPTAVLFSSLLMAIAVMARSYKEAQSYVTPLMMLVIIPSMAAFMPGLELNEALAWIPVTSIALGVKSVLLTARGEGYQWGGLIMVFVSSGVYSLIGLFLARQMFNKESVLFRT